MGYYLGEIFFDNCVNVNGAPRMRTPSRRSGARSCHAPAGRPRGGLGCTRSAGGSAAVCGAPAGRVPVLGRFHHRRTPCLCAGFVGARHRGIVELSAGVIRCVTVFACYSSSSSCDACNRMVRVRNPSLLLLLCCSIPGPGCGVHRSAVPLVYFQ